MSAEEKSARRLVPVWTALSVTTALPIGVGAGILDWLGGQAVPVAILTGGLAFGGSVTLAILIINTLCR